MTRWLHFAAGTLLGVLVMDRAWSLFDPLLRSESASDLTVVQHDNNWTAIGTEINHANLQALRGVASPVADRLPMWTSATAMALLPAGTTGKAVLAAATAGAGQTALSLVPGTNVQAFDADLQAVADLAGQTTYGRSLLTLANQAALQAAAATSAGRILVAQMDCVPPATLNMTPNTLVGTSAPNEQSFQYWNAPEGSDTHLDCAGRFPAWWTAGTVNIKYCMSNTVASNAVAMTAAIRNLAEDLDGTAHTYSYTSTPLTMSGTIGTPTCGTIALTGAALDGLSGGGFFNLRLQRDGDNGAADTSTGAAQLLERSLVLEAG